jgi:hypothetical protein
VLLGYASTILSLSGTTKDAMNCLYEPPAGKKNQSGADEEQRHNETPPPSPGANVIPVET